MRETIRRRIEEYIKYMKEKTEEESRFLFKDIKYYPSLEKDIWLILKSFANDMRYMKMSDEWIPVIKGLKQFISLTSIDPETNKTFFSSLFEEKIKKPGLIYALINVLKSEIQKTLLPKKAVLIWGDLKDNERVIYSIFDNYLKCIVDTIIVNENLLKRTILEKEQWSKSALLLLSELDFKSQDHLLTYIQQNILISDLIMQVKDPVYFEIKNKLSYHNQGRENFPINRSIAVLSIDQDKIFSCAWCNSLMFMTLFIEKNVHVIEKIPVNVSLEEIIKEGNINSDFMKIETSSRFKYVEKNIEKRINACDIKMSGLSSIKNPLMKKKEYAISNLHSWKIFTEKVFMNVNIIPVISSNSVKQQQRKRL